MTALQPPAARLSFGEILPLNAAVATLRDFRTVQKKENLGRRPHARSGLVPGAGLSARRIQDPELVERQAIRPPRAPRLRVRNDSGMVARGGAENAEASRP